jgi:hypothetical protein
MELSTTPTPTLCLDILKIIALLKEETGKCVFDMFVFNLKLQLMEHHDIFS